MPLPAKLLIKNVDFSENYKIMINKEIEYGTVIILKKCIFLLFFYFWILLGKFEIKPRNLKTPAPTAISWKASIDNSGIIEKLVPICIKLGIIKPQTFKAIK